MTPSEAVTLAAAAKAAVSIGEEAARGFLSTVLGPAAEEAGLLLKDRVRSRRFKRQVEALIQARQQVEEAGLSPNAIPLRTLIPLLEGASLEEDETLSRKWASLIANASVSSPDAIPPCFADVMKALSPNDARILDLLYTKGLGQRGQIKVGIVFYQHELDSTNFGISMENLHRLRLIEDESPRRGASKAAGMDHLNGEWRVYSTYMGSAFIKACSPVPAGISDR